MSDLQRRTEALLRGKGYLVASVERRKRFPDPKSKKCQACGLVRFLDIASDMFNVFDLACFRPTGGGVVLVQVTSSSNHASRRNKILASNEALLCLLSGASILVQSWRKVDNRWMPHDEWISRDQFVTGLAETAEQFYADQQRLNLLDRKKRLPALPPGTTLPLSGGLDDESIPF